MSRQIALLHFAALSFVFEHVLEELLVVRELLVLQQLLPEFVIVGDNQSAQDRAQVAQLLLDAGHLRELAHEAQREKE